VPPNYWYGDQVGAAFGFGSELGPGVGTPELSSLKKFLTTADMNDLWTAPDRDLFHMSRYDSQFYDRSIYNDGLYARYGVPTSLSDYLLKAQLSDYEGTRSEYEAYSVRKNAERPATGLIYWMMNNAWPSLHWNFFDYYLKGAGSYYGAKMGSRPEHVAFEYGSTNGDIWIINHTIDKRGARSIGIDLLSKDGKTIISKTVTATTIPNLSQHITTVPEAAKIKKPAFLKLVLRDGNGGVLSRNVYWLSPTVDELDWDNSTWYNTPVTKYANYKALFSIKSAKLTVTAYRSISPTAEGRVESSIVLQSTAKVPAFFIRLELQDTSGADINPAFWEDNYVTLWPGEKLTVGVQWLAADAKNGASVRISGVNIGQVEDVVLK
jgi:exo-1,4-beta-D-glucosaminidase